MEEDVLGTGFDWGKELADFKPEVNKDNGFPELKGNYVAKVVSCVHDIGAYQSGDAYDRYQLRVQITETITGDKGNNRFLNKRYQNTADGVKALANDLLTAGVTVDLSNPQAFDLSLNQATDKIIFISAWKAKAYIKQGEDFIEKKDAEGNGMTTQKFKVVKEFKGKKQATTEPTPF